MIRMFGPEDVWTEALNLDQNITLPGLSPLYPNVTCSSAGDVCHLTLGEAEVNAACSMSVSFPQLLFMYLHRLTPSISGFVAIVRL